jgi:hypothetical protein
MLVVMVAGLFMFQGCSTVRDIPDEDLARGIRTAARGAAQYGLGYVLNKEPAKAAAVADGARLAVKALRENVIPALSGSSTQEVLRSAVETALDELSKKLTPSVVLAVQLALDVVAANVTLPVNPADRLSDRTKGALLALFQGLADGLEAGASLAPVRDTPPAKLFWPKN